MKSKIFNSDDELLEFVIDCFQNPIKHSDVLRGYSTLSMNLSHILECAAGKCRSQLNDADKILAKDASVFFIENVLLSVNSNFYQILGVTAKASSAEIKHNHRLLINLYHPDRMGSHDEWKRDFASKINVAYATLIKPSLRASYDFDLAIKNDFNQNTEAELLKDVSLHSHVNSQKKYSSSRLSDFIHTKSNFFFIAVTVFLCSIFLVVYNSSNQDIIVYNPSSKDPKPVDNVLNLTGVFNDPSKLTGSAADVSTDHAQSGVANSHQSIQVLGGKTEKEAKETYEAKTKPEVKPEASADDQSRLKLEIKTKEESRAKLDSVTKLETQAKVGLEHVTLLTDGQSELKLGSKANDEIRTKQEEPVELNVVVQSNKGVESKSVRAVRPDSDPSALNSLVNKINPSSLDDFVNYFIKYYQMGDIKSFMSLFDLQVKSSEGGYSYIYDDYSDFFRSTKLRKMDLGAFSWTFGDNYASGMASYVVNIIGVDGEEKKQSGFVSMGVVYRSGTILITSIDYKVK